MHDGRGEITRARRAELSEEASEATSREPTLVEFEQWCYHGRITPLDQPDPLRENHSITLGSGGGVSTLGSSAGAACQRTSSDDDR